MAYDASQGGIRALPGPRLGYYIWRPRLERAREDGRHVRLGRWSLLKCSEAEARGVRASTRVPCSTSLYISVRDLRSSRKNQFEFQPRPFRLSVMAPDATRPSFLVALRHQSSFLRHQSGLLARCTGAADTSAALRPDSWLELA
eukprot:2416906-Prymnesium_polylepis.1